MQWIFEGKSAFGQEGTGFLYTNHDSISLGILTQIDTIRADGAAVTEMVDRFKENPEIKELLQGGKLAEYSAHLLPKGGSLSKLYRDGLLVIGDAAGLVVNKGYVVRGMDLAVESARIAAETVVKASEAGDFGEEMLKNYETGLRESFLWEEMKRQESYNEELAEIFA